MPADSNRRPAPASPSKAYDDRKSGQDFFRSPPDHSLGLASPVDRSPLRWRPGGGGPVSGPGRGSVSCGRRAALRSRRWPRPRRPSHALFLDRSIHRVRAAPPRDGREG
ncbi:MAG: hypothetical protein ACK55I_27335, partial [bacterium]